MSLYDKLADAVPQIKRGRVWCRHCGASRAVDGAGALQHGWPKCCGYTMTIDSPEEQRRLAQQDTKP